MPRPWGLIGTDLSAGMSSVGGCWKVSRPLENLSFNLPRPNGQSHDSRKWTINNDHKAFSSSEMPVRNLHAPGWHHSYSQMMPTWPFLANIYITINDYIGNIWKAFNNNIVWCWMRDSRQWNDKRSGCLIWLCRPPWLSYDNLFSNKDWKLAFFSTLIGLI